MTRRLIVWAAAIAALIAGAVWLADNPGSATLEWRGWRVDSSVAVLIGAVAVVAIAAAIIYRGAWALWGLPRRLLFWRRMARREKGYRTLTRGLVAVAAGEAEEARKLAARAEKLLGDPPLTKLLTAQAAQLIGDETAARKHFADMLDRPETAFLGLRGLILAARKEGNRAAALEYAKRAYAIRPKTSWAATTLLDLQIGQSLWREALTTVEAAIRHGILTGEDGRRRRVVVLLACSGAAGESGEAKAALDFARRASGLDPDFLPATLRHAGLLIGGGRGRQAAKLIQDAWSRTPHPELARLFLSIHAGEDAIGRMRRMERLAAHNSGHVESHLALAAAAVDAKLWATARKHFDEAEEAGRRDGRLCRLRADAEEAEHGDTEAARRWLVAAAEAAPDPAWVCGDCGAVWRHWTPVCGRCESFAGLAWSTPEHVREDVPAQKAVPSGGTGMVEASPPAPVPTGDAAFAETRPAGS